MKIRKEVDFHHKIAYKFEKAYHLGKVDPGRESINKDIIGQIGEHSDYLEQDPMSLFYMLYFCIYFNNPVIANFLSALS